MMVFVYGQTPYPQQTFDIYVPLARDDLPAGGENRIRFRYMMKRITGYNEWAEWGRRGHRHGKKGRTLRSYRRGA